MSVKSLFALEPHWVPGRWSSAMVGISLFRSTKQGFSCDGEQRYPSVARAVLFSPCFCTIYKDCIIEIAGKFPFLPKTDDEFMELAVQCWTSIFPYPIPF